MIDERSTIDEVKRDHRSIAWILLSWAAVTLLPGYMRFGSPIWLLPIGWFIQALGLGATFLGYPLLGEFLRRLLDRCRQKIKLPVSANFIELTATILSCGICFAAACALLLPRSDFEISRLLVLIAGAIGTALAVARLYLGRYRRIAVASLSLVLAANMAFGLKATLKVSRNPAVQEYKVPSEFYQLAVTVHVQPLGEIRKGMTGGGIVAFGADYLLSTGDGVFYRLRLDNDGSLRPSRLSFAAPLEREMYLAAQANGENAMAFRVTGIALDASVAPAQLFVAYDYWNARKSCFTMRVSSIELDQDSMLPPPRTSWKTIFESQPCLGISPGFDNLQTGGRLALTPDKRLLFTLGDRGLNGLNGVAVSQEPSSDYGKVLELDRAGGKTIFSMGHRNPQGLLVDSRSHVWSTEHGPQGGDELNELLSGENYGWPLATYGTDYGFDVWPFAPDARDHGAFHEPVYTFVPSIGISNLIEVGAGPFTRWKGDLLISSLRAESLYRVRLRDQRVVYVEPIVVKHRIRDLTQGRDGRILLWTDEGDIVVLTAAVLNSAYDRRCSGCHEPSAGRPALGPSLRNVVGRRIASNFEFRYSPALRNTQGQWTEERLDAFIKSPSSVVQGTTMGFTGIPDDAERAEIVEFLKSY